MPYSTLLGITVGLSVLFVLIGWRLARADTGSTGQLAHFLDDDLSSLLNESYEYTHATPRFRDRVLIPAGRGLLQRLGRLAPSYNVEVLTARLETAGRPHGLNVLNFLGLKFIAALLFAALGFALFTLLLKQSVTLGFYVPNVWLGVVIRERKHAILRALPDALDMIVVCTEAGQTFDQALRRVGEYWHTPLTDEFNRILVEMQLGRTRREALSAASERIQLTEMANLIAAIIQADELGVSIGKVLRIQAGQLRTARRQRAEELAHQAAIKLLFPLVFLIFPSMLAVLLGPAIPLILETFANVGGG